jgi:multisubunit Na+/H+ antiporter MnhB subunit
VAATVTSGVAALELAFDVALALALVGAAVVIIWAANTFTATALFIVFGVMMAVAWGRLGAVDIALAEAAIGAGITGALLLHAQGAEAAKVATRPRRAVSLRRWRVDAVVALGAALVALALVAALWTAPDELTGLGPQVEARSVEAGAENPVTVVLLNLRAYDTLLEVVVLVAAVVAAWALALRRPPAPPAPGLLLVSMTRLVAPITVLIGGYLLWRGTFAPGGAFQAGAVIAGAAILGLLAEFSPPRRDLSRVVRAALVVGVLVFVIAGAVGPLVGDPALTYRGEAASRWILAVEIGATISIALALIAVFIGRAPSAWGRGG